MAMPSSSSGAAGSSAAVAAGDEQDEGFDMNNNDPNNNTDFAEPDVEEIEPEVEKPEDIQFKLLKEARAINGVLDRYTIDEIYAYLEASIDHPQRMQFVMNAFLTRDMTEGGGDMDGTASRSKRLRNTFDGSPPAKKEKQAENNNDFDLLDDDDSELLAMNDTIYLSDDDDPGRQVPTLPPHAVLMGMVPDPDRPLRDEQVRTLQEMFPSMDPQTLEDRYMEIFPIEGERTLDMLVAQMLDFQEGPELPLDFEIFNNQVSEPVAAIPADQEDPVIVNFQTDPNEDSQVSSGEAENPDTKLPGSSKDPQPGSSAETLPGPSIQLLPGSSKDGIAGDDRLAIAGSSRDPIPGSSKDEDEWTDPDGETVSVDPELQEQMSYLTAVLPDADPSFLQEKCNELRNNKDAMSAFVAEAMENKNYPTLAEYTKRTEANRELEKFAGRLSVKDFLEIFPDPDAHFKKSDHKNDPEYLERCLFYLLGRFRNVAKQGITNSLRRNNNLTKVVEELTKGIGVSYLKKARPVGQLPEHLNDCKHLHFLQEVTYLEKKGEIETYKQNLEQEKKLKFEEAKKKGELLECGCCFDGDCLITDMSTCPDGHLFCKECIKRYAENEIGDGKLAFKCLEGDCKEEFTLTVLQEVLSAKLFSRLVQKKQLEEVQAANIEGLETCPFCDFGTIPAPGDKIFRCLNPDCMKDSCRECREPSHIPLRCDEVENDDEVKARKFLEDRMTEALVRECWKCHKKFVKQDGCNKMVCTCGAKMCYMCRQPITGYDHFRDKNAAATTNPQDNTKCPLWVNNEELHVKAVTDVTKTAMAELKAINPNMKLKHDPTKILPVAQPTQDLDYRRRRVMDNIRRCMTLLAENNNNNGRVAARLRIRYHPLIDAQAEPRANINAGGEYFRDAVQMALGEDRRNVLGQMGPEGNVHLERAGYNVEWYRNAITQVLNFRRQQNALLVGNNVGQRDVGNQFDNVARPPERPRIQHARLVPPDNNNPHHALPGNLERPIGTNAPKCQNWIVPFDVDDNVQPPKMANIRLRDPHLDVPALAQPQQQDNHVQFNANHTVQVAPPIMQGVPVNHNANEAALRAGVQAGNNAQQQGEYREVQHNQNLINAKDDAVSLRDSRLALRVIQAQLKHLQNRVGQAIASMPVDAGEDDKGPLQAARNVQSQIKVLCGQASKLEQVQMHIGEMYPGKIKALQNLRDRTKRVMIQVNVAVRNAGLNLAVRNLMDSSHGGENTQLAQDNNPLQNVQGALGNNAQGLVINNGQAAAVCNGQAPAECNGQAPAESNGQAPAERNGQAPAVCNGQAPAVCNGQAPAVCNGQAPAVCNGQAPAVCNGQAPAVCNGQAPAVCNGQAPAVCNGQAPAVCNGQAPAFYNDRISAFYNDQMLAAYTGQAPAVYNGQAPAAYNMQGVAANNVPGAAAANIRAQAWNNLPAPLMRPVLDRPVLPEFRPGYMINYAPHASMGRHIGFGNGANIVQQVGPANAVGAINGERPRLPHGGVEVNGEMARMAYGACAINGERPPGAYAAGVVNGERHRGANGERHRGANGERHRGANGERHRGANGERHRAGKNANEQDEDALKRELETNQQKLLKVRKAEARAQAGAALADHKGDRDDVKKFKAEIKSAKQAQVRYRTNVEVVKRKLEILRKAKKKLKKRQDAHAERPNPPPQRVFAHLADIPRPMDIPRVVNVPLLQPPAPIAEHGNIQELFHNGRFVMHRADFPHMLPAAPHLPAEQPRIMQQQEAVDAMFVAQAQRGAAVMQMQGNLRPPGIPHHLLFYHVGRAPNHRRRRAIRIAPNGGQRLYQARAPNQLNSIPYLYHIYPGQHPYQPYQAPVPNQLYQAPNLNQPNQAPVPNQLYQAPHLNQHYQVPIPNQPYQALHPNQPYQVPIPNQPYQAPIPNQPYQAPYRNQPYRAAVPNQLYQVQYPNRQNPAHRDPVFNDTLIALQLAAQELDIEVDIRLQN